VRPGQEITMRFNAWAPHPGTWSTFVTRDGFDPTQPLRWADLEPTPFNEVTNPPLNGSGPHGAEWTWPATVPANKSGRHIFYTIWQRNDSPEAFYSCSDVVFAGAASSSPLTTRWAPMVELVASLEGIGTPSYVREPEPQSHHH
jgi:chitin-binding protein